MRNEELRKELLRMHAADDRVFSDLGRGPSFHGDYHPEMEAVHRRNALRLVEIMEDVGWPGRPMVGEAGMRAAWRIAQHAISLPEVQRRALPLLQAAVAKGEAPAWQAAYLEDRIRICQGQPQRYGTQFDWDDEGLMSPCTIEDPDRIDERRAAVGMRPLKEEIEESRKAIALSREQPPQDYHQRRDRMEEWAKSVGWRRQRGE